MFPQTPHIECVALLEQGVSRGFGVAAGPRPRGRADRWRHAASSSATTRSGPTTTRRQGPGDPGRVRGAEPSDVELGVAVIALDRQPPDEIAADIERARTSTATRLWIGVGAGFSEKPLTSDARGRRRAARGAPRGPPRARRDGPEDVRPRRRRVRRRLLQLDDARLRRRRASGNVEAGAARRRTRHPAGLRLRPHRGRARRRRRLAKEESFYRDLHDGYRNHFARLGEPEGTVGVAAADAAEAQRQLAAYEALDTIVVRGLASATVEAMAALAEAARAMRRAGLGSLLLPWRRRRLLAAPAAAPGRSRSREAAAAKGPLGHAGRWITDRRGRVVILHGFNMVYKVPPYAPDRIGFGARRRRLPAPLRLQHDPPRPDLQGGRARSPAATTTPTWRGSARTQRQLARQRHLLPARLPPGPLQRALRGRGLARLGGARRRRPGRAADRLSRPATSPARASTAPSTTSGRTRPAPAASASRTATPPPGAASPPTSAAAPDDGLRPAQRALAGQRLAGLLPRPTAAPTFDSGPFTAVLRAHDHRDPQRRPAQA